MVARRGGRVEGANGPMLGGRGGPGGARGGKLILILSLQLSNKTDILSF